jgi:hypothetical protein
LAFAGQPRDTAWEILNVGAEFRNMCISIFMYVTFVNKHFLRTAYHGAVLDPGGKEMSKSLQWLFKLVADTDKPMSTISAT